MSRQEGTHPGKATLSRPLRDEVALLQRSLDQLAAAVMRLSLTYEDLVTADGP